MFGVNLNIMSSDTTITQRLDNLDRLNKLVGEFKLSKSDPDRYSLLKEACHSSEFQAIEHLLIEIPLDSQCALLSLLAVGEGNILLPMLRDVDHKNKPFLNLVEQLTLIDFFYNIDK